MNIEQRLANIVRNTPCTCGNWKVKCTRCETLAEYDAQQTATRGPWNLRMRHVGGAFIYEDDETLVATCDDENTAARIVQRVNAHDTLVSALRGAHDALRRHFDGMCDGTEVKAALAARGALEAAGVQP